MRSIFFVLCSVMVSCSAVSAQPIEWPRIELTLLVGGLSKPTHITDAGDGSRRLFLVEQQGTVRIFADGVLRDEPFLDIRDRVLAGDERGLLSIAFPPGFSDSQRFYVYYTNRLGDITIARYNVTADPDVADPASEAIVLIIPHPIFDNHNGGQLAFGPNDGYLYIGTGDGGGAEDPFLNAQNPAVLLGKLLRIDVESGAVPYGIPPDNPFLGIEGARPELWAIGLRNPWRFSFDAQTRDLYIADVGENRYEEVDFQPASSPGGENYGWNIMEGAHCFEPMKGCDQTGLTLPVAEYDHSRGDCSITGGFVYRGTDYPGMRGIYFYGDFCTSRIWGLRFDGTAWQTSLLLDHDPTAGINISTFGKDEDGNLFLAHHGRKGKMDGAIYLVRQLR